MNEKKVRALFELADLGIEELYRLENEYWPNYPDYYEIRAANPWWLVSTKHGRIKIGWRKRVIKIDWQACAFRGEITADDVTKSDTMVHAWSYAKAVEYLTALSQKLKEL